MDLPAPPPRSTEAELIDAEGQDPVEFAHSLRQVARVDRLLGAEGALRRRLVEAGLAEGIGSVLDVGAGSGELLVRLGRWLASRPGSDGLPRSLALDPHPEVIALGRRARPELEWIRGDGSEIPLPDRSVDLVVSVLTLHHLEEEAAVTLLGEMARVARHGVVVSDLERSRLHWVGARLLAATLWRGNRLTRRDAPNSVLRAFTRGELAGLLDRAGLPGAELRRHLPWRLIAVARR